MRDLIYLAILAVMVTPAFLLVWGCEKLRSNTKVSSPALKPEFFS